MSIISKRLNLIKPSPTLEVATRAIMLKESGKDVINLGVGEPDFDTPSNIKKAAKLAIDNGFTKYTAVDGIKDLKEAIRRKFKNENGLEYELNQVMVSNGGKQAIYNMLLASLDPGDEVVIPAPYWVSYPDMVLLTGGVPVIVETTSENNFLITPEQLESAITSKTKWLIINSPSNPTGSVYSQEDLQKIADILLKYENVHVMTDDMYEHLLFDNTKFFNIAMVEPKLKDRVLIINGVSKSYAMTGWRIGYAAGDKNLISAMTKIQSQVTSNPCTISQKAALEALTGDQSFLVLNRKTFQRRRNLVQILVSNIDGLECLKIQGAFYAFIKCQNFIGKKTTTGKMIDSDNDFAKFLLDEALVAVVPGEAFGKAGYFRVSFALSDETIEEAFKRIKKACITLC